MTYPIAGYNSYMNYGHYQFNNTVAARNVTFTSQPDMVSLSTNNQVQEKKGEVYLRMQNWDWEH